VQFLKTTLIGGIVFLVPLVVLAAIVGQAVAIAYTTLVPLAEYLPVRTVGGVALLTLLAIGAVVMLCFFAGLLARTTLARRGVEWLEQTFLAPIPGYLFMKHMRQNMLGIRPGRQYEPVLARIAGAWQIGFLLARTDDARVAVFVPGAPNAWTGQMYFLAEDGVERLEVEASKALYCIESLGDGAREMLARPT
jgi:uncharacterized membrane protein